MSLFSVIAEMESAWSQRHSGQRGGKSIGVSEERLNKMQRCHMDGGCERNPAGQIKDKRECFECMDEFYSKMHY